MAPWDARQYLRFEAERTRPCAELVGRIALERPRTIVDLGCGPGTSTDVLRARWPAAAITGIDSSEEMLRTARARLPAGAWVQGDLASWEPPAPLDLVFSNAALQWVPGHRELLPRLWRGVAPRGALAFQLPAPGPERAPWTEALAEAFGRTAPTGRELPVDPTSHVLSVPEYYDLLTSLGAERVDLWDTVYSHAMPGPEGVVAWTQGTALRPVLERLGSDERRAGFLEVYGRGIAERYPPRGDGTVLFPFRRRFGIGYRR